MKRSYDNISGDRPGGGGRNRHGGRGRDGGGGRHYGRDNRGEGRGGYGGRDGGGYYGPPPSAAGGDSRGSGGSNYYGGDDRGGFGRGRGGYLYGGRGRGVQGGGGYGGGRGGGGRDHYGPGAGGNDGGGTGGYDRGPRGSGFGGGTRPSTGRGGGRGAGVGPMRGGRGRAGRGGRDNRPDLSGISSVLTNIILANVTSGFQFFLYSVDCSDSTGNQIDSRYRRKFLFDLGFWDGFLKHMPEKEKSDLRRVVFFCGSYFFAARAIPGIEPGSLPMDLPVAGAEGDTIRIMKFEHYTAPVELMTPIDKLSADQVVFDKRCADCTRAFVDVGSLLQHCKQAGHKPVYLPGNSDTTARPAKTEVFISYVNQALQRALGERLARWGSEYIDPQNVTEPADRLGNSLGVRVYEAFSCTFGLLRNPQGSATLALTVDLRAKVVRTRSVLDHLYGEQGPGNRQFRPQEENAAKREWIGEVVISMHDKTCYTVVDLVFEHSATTMPIDGLGISHAEYFEKRKGVVLKYPNAVPMIAVLGRRNQTIHLPPELVAGNELENRVKEQLPMIASFAPEARNKAIEKIRAYLVPGAQKAKDAGGLLPALGVVLNINRLSVKAEVLPLPRMLAMGVQVPASSGANWAPLLNRADFHVQPGQANTLNVILVYHEKLEQGARRVYDKIRDLVNGMNSTFRFSNAPIEMIRAGDLENHWGPVEKCLADAGSRSVQNIFVLDFNNPRGFSDLAYPVIKGMLAANGYLSQFVNFKTYSHDKPKDQKRSSLILQGVARQIIQKTGTRLWWVNVPASLPTPCLFVGVDVFHAPRVYDAKQHKKVARGSCAAVIVQINRGGNQQRSQIELFSQTFVREPGKEFDLRDALKLTVSTALRELNVAPQSCIIWRDGIGQSSFDSAALEEIDGIRAGLKAGPVGTSTAQAADVPLSYIVCQKRIDTKILAKGVAGEPDGKHGAPSGTLVEGIQELYHNTFYINGNAPPFSTPKPVRFIVVHKDKLLEKVPLPQLTWDLCHDYPNWTGPIKVPSVVQLAHKLAELGGGFADGGESINASKFKNTLHFL